MRYTKCLTNLQGDKEINIRNFLGEKVIRVRHMLDGVTVKASGNKDEIYVEVRISDYLVVEKKIQLESLCPVAPVDFVM